jgi:hypothetical protein
VEKRNHGFTKEAIVFGGVVLFAPPLLIEIMRQLLALLIAWILSSLVG